MIYSLGVDAGSVLCKAVVLRERRVAAWRAAPTRGDMAAVIEPLIAGALEEAGVARDDLAAFGGTGRFRQAVAGADVQEGDLACVAWAAREVRPEVEIKYSFDERVEDGLACAISLAGQVELIQDPGRFAEGITDHKGQVPRA